MNERLKQELKLWVTFFLIALFTTVWAYLQMVESAFEGEENVNLNGVFRKMWESFLRSWIITFLLLSVTRFVVAFLVQKFRHRRDS